MHTLTYTQHSLTVHEHRLDVPLDHGAPGGESIQLFAREIVRPGGENLPHLVFLQGGPGGKAPRLGDFNGGWVGRAIKDYRVVLMDQRGTGQSTRMDAQALAALPDDQARADHLMLFRQDQIINDAELLRHELTGGRPWTTLGQSYGGFLTMTYLSQAPEGVEASLVTGGLPGLVDIDTIYRLTYERTAQRNRTYLARYPGDEATIRDIASHLRDHDERLHTGERLSPERFRLTGMALGMSTGFDTLHYLFEGPWVSVSGQRRLSAEFIDEVGAAVSFAPMYAVLQEAIYAGATPALSGTATTWAADRLARETPGFVPDANPQDRSEPWYLCGEHMPRAIFDQDPQLAPLAGVADILATRTDWAPVYSPDAVASSKAPLAAAVYYDDMFVPRELSMDTASLIPGARTWVTSEYQHDGLRASDDKVVDHLLGLLRD